MDEKEIRIEAYEKMRRELFYKFNEAFADKWSKILMNNVNEVADKLKEREQG